MRVLELQGGAASCDMHGDVCARAGCASVFPPTRRLQPNACTRLPHAYRTACMRIAEPCASPRHNRSL